MRRIFLIILIIENLIAISQTATSFNTHFGSSEDDIGYSIIQRLSGGYYSVGSTDGFNAVQNDILLVKEDSLGIPIWQKTFGGVGAEIGESIVELSDSSVVFAGFTNSFGNGGYDAYILRTDKNGVLLWQQTFGGLDWDFAYSINKTSDGNLIICGSTYSYGRGNKDAFILKIDYSGNFLWNKVYGGLHDDELKKIIQTDDGGYIATGTTKSYGDSLGDIWITKFDPMGDSSWFRTRGGNKNDVGNSIVQDKNHNYLVTGGSQSFSSGGEDAYIFKLSTNGNFIWDKFYGLPTEDEESFDVLNSSSQYGNIVITFGTKEQLSYGLDIKTLLLDSIGSYVRGGSFGGPLDDIGYSLFNTKDKGYVACGYTESFNALKKDFFVVKYDSQMTIGPLIVSIKEILSDQYFGIYPTLIYDSFVFVDKLKQTSSTFTNVKIFDVFGRPVEDIKIEEISIKTLKISLPQNLKGLIFVSIDDGALVRKCIIQ